MSELPTKFEVVRPQWHAAIADHACVIVPSFSTGIRCPSVRAAGPPYVSGRAPGLEEFGRDVDLTRRSGLSPPRALLELAGLEASGGRSLWPGPATDLQYSAYSSK